MNAIIISLGNLHTSLLGCYGGPWLETPALDSFAANAFVFDQCYVECPTPESTRRNWCTGRLQHSARASAKPDCPPPSLITNLRASGVRTILVTDSGSLVSPSQAMAGFEQVIEITREEEDTTQELFDAAIKWLSHDSNGSPFLLFVDCHGAHQPIRIEADPTESDRTSDGPDDPFVSAALYLDQQAGRFLEWLQSQSHWDQSLVAFTSDAGCVPELCVRDRGSRLELSEWRMHIPLLLRVPNTEPAGRSFALVQSIDLIPTVFEAIGIGLPNSIDGMSLLPICRGNQKDVRSFAQLSIPGGPRAVRTCNWYLVDPQISPGQVDPADLQLFAKPEDRWDRDNVAKRYPGIVVELSQLLEDQTAGSRGTEQPI